MKLLYRVFIDLLFVALAMLFFAFFIYMSGKVPEFFMMYVVYGGFCLSFYFSYRLRKIFMT
ncbi:Uncharacterised protein [Yersinia pseudotuberculosis]|uniref:Uncharacterized protein n=2 Tax=Yersinia pseudotuberculosis complex TaxID=1649845 RepID=A0A0T9QW59_9GAMM|nr:MULTISPECIES: hypothetical protein [Yersinia pseudotuberculosis complex]CFQ67813.1 Uncharacterised protein [Yersinia similis]CFV29673.1 Uncharacterised protein [Yersinia pseudotuberculosis]CNC07884.1 Uncharacterised protein [Yersinia similis]CNF55813.1 Uncharacterised protein [Yersinia similis]CNF75952.1 Uncharacterised protein [Yersinia similis]